MNKYFFTIILLALVSQSHGMDSLYPHDYQCTRHHHKGPYPHYISMSHLTNELLNKGDWIDLLIKEYSGFHVEEAQDRAYDQFVDGKAPLVIARRAFDQQQSQELESLSQQTIQASRALFTVLGRPIGVEERDNEHWRNLRARLANPPADQIAWWIARLNEQPELWKAIEKTALTANIFSSKKPEFFQKSSSSYYCKKPGCSFLCSKHFIH